MITNKRPAPRSFSKAGFSLVEVLVFVTVLSLFFVIALTVTTFNLRNLKIQEHKILATRYAEEGMEWVKQEKEDDWQSFSLHDDGTGTTYCINSLNWNTSNASVDYDCNDYGLGNPVSIFSRSLVITNSSTPVDSAATKVTVSWKENNVVQSVVLKSVLNLWE